MALWNGRFIFTIFAVMYERLTAFPILGCGPGLSKDHAPVDRQGLDAKRRTFAVSTVPQTLYKVPFAQRRNGGHRARGRRRGGRWRGQRCGVVAPPLAFCTDISSWLRDRED